MLKSIGRGITSPFFLRLKFDDGIIYVCIIAIHSYIITISEIYHIFLKKQRTAITINNK